MATEAQIAANRRNAQLSTGPRTPEGKARSSRNHLVHGLLANGLIEGESADDFRAIHEDFRSHYNPQNPVESALVERIATAYFRLGRFAHVEAQFLQREHAEKEVPAWSAHAQPFDRVANSFRQNVKPLHYLSLYEGRYERAFDRAVRQLQLLQSQRQREAPQSTPTKPSASEMVSAAPAAPPEPVPEPTPAPEPAVASPATSEIGFECSNCIAPTTLPNILPAPSFNLQSPPVTITSIARNGTAMLDSCLPRP